MNLDYNQQAFFALVRAGLWEKDVRLLHLKNVDFNEVYRFAGEQSLVGLIAAGIEHVVDVKISQSVALMFVGDTLQLEQRNKAMNQFVARLVERLRKEDILTLLVKGQGIAQCYERPLWRACGDVDFLLDEDNYERAKDYLLPLASSVDEEEKERLHIAVVINQWIVELHGSLHSQVFPQINKIADVVQNDTFKNKNVRVWRNQETDIFLPAPDNDVFFVFSHILQHFWDGGIGIRQICDWCRLLWTYRGKLNLNLLEIRLKDAGIFSEWNIFAIFAVEWLGMPKEAMPFCLCSSSAKRKAKRLSSFILDVGNFGHNNDRSFRQNSSPFMRKIKMFSCVTKDFFQQVMIFPIDAVRVWFRIMRIGLGLIMLK